MDEARQHRLALGPIEIALRRRGDDEMRRIGVAGSVLFHIVVVLVWLLVTPFRHTPREAESVLAAEPPVSVTFVNPFPPPPPPPQAVAEFRPSPPQPATAKPLRMQEPPREDPAVSERAAARTQERDAGRGDTRPAGGESGGPLPDPRPGVPEITGDSGSAAEEPKDLQGRLRDFKRALETPAPPGAKGGGSGTGGVTMPNVPTIGTGIGNLEFESRDYDWSSYARQIHRLIWVAWHNRLLTTSGVFERWAAEHQRWLIDPRARIVFTIERSGQISGVAVQTPSGCYPFDDSATDALREVLLPPLPSDFPREQERVHATFVGEDINIRGMRTGLQWLKDRGVF